ncbi:MAG: hypothetical protein HYZ48_02275 [Chlamydiales bacterium]|nr:hypothetical protein [Chlamydiales bacterium]
MNPHKQNYLSLIDDVIQYVKERPEETAYFSIPLPKLPPPPQKELTLPKLLAQAAPTLVHRKLSDVVHMKDLHSSPSLIEIPQKIVEVTKTVTIAPLLKEKEKAPIIKEEKKGALFTLEPLKEAPPLLLDQIRKKALEIDPTLSLHTKPPDDAKARKIKEEWREKREIPLLPILTHTTRYLPFLKNLAKAISFTFLPCRVLEVISFEKEKKWDLFFSSSHVNLVILSDQTLWESKELLLNYKENPQKKERFLASFPLLLLPDLSLYEKDPYLKRSLWNLLCQTIEKIKK